MTVQAPGSLAKDVGATWVRRERVAWKSSFGGRPTVGRAHTVKVPAEMADEQGNTFVRAKRYLKNQKRFEPLISGQIFGAAMDEIDSLFKKIFHG